MQGWTDARQTGLGVFILLGIVITRNPPGGMIARHGKLCTLFLDGKVVETAFLRELIA